MSRFVLDEELRTAEAGLEWEDSPCPMCGRHEEEPRFEAADVTPAVGQPAKRFLVVRCRHCGLTYTNPRPSASQIGQFYPTDYKPHLLHKESSRRKPLFGRTSERRGNLPWNGVGRLLDYGCGSGSYLKRMADLGWKVTGVDISEESVESIRQEMGLTAHVGSLPHPELEPGSFDIITMWQSLEHVHQPLAILREAFDLLTPGGKVVVAVPNIDSWDFHQYGVNWFGLDVPRHLTHFTPTTLQMMVQTAGFRIEANRTIRHNSWIRSSAKLAAAKKERGPRMLKSKPLARLAGLYAHWRGKSDCILVVGQRP